MSFQPADEDLMLPSDDQVRAETQADLDAALALRNDLRAAMDKARALSGRPGFRQPGRVVARHVEDAICSMNDWFGGPDDEGYKLRPPIATPCARCGRTDSIKGLLSSSKTGKVELCHANPDGTKADPDCYHLVTVYGQPVTADK